MRCGDIAVAVIALLVLGQIQSPRQSRVVGAVMLSAVVCGRIPGLTKQQREMCQKAPHVMAVIGEGAELGLKECRHQFRNHRWNCSQLVDNQIFGHVFVVGSREAAFMYAISSAAITYAVTAACSRGNITACGCEPTTRTRKEMPPNGWEWGGCSADVSYGMRIARRFLDSREIEGDARSLMNLHNNKAGRKIVKTMLDVECKCHGVSGSCTVRTCWRTLPSFREIGDVLMRKYDRARSVVPISPPSAPTVHSTEVVLRSSEVSPILGNDAKTQGKPSDGLRSPTEEDPGSVGDAPWTLWRPGSEPKVRVAPGLLLTRQHQPKKLHLVLKRASKISGGAASSLQKRFPKRSELVYLQQSPNYCEPDLEQGSFGTQGRYCNRTSKETHGCDLMCCGRGYNTHQYTRTWQCACKFIWCCKVQCDTCTERIEEYTCK
ncbi:protein Wnt-7b [Copidosoma floridanum]|uniref:protein Wnt-7b n=1 Tax=Copidosoma floridanum TaxID=29053 RepID=UPI0006C9519F|nr:protein Wnt-7b [Copidosoma floridanum]